MKRLTILLLAGWMGWIDTTRWHDVDDSQSDPRAAQVSAAAKTAADRREPSESQKGKRAPKLRDILLGPRAQTWREVKTQRIQ